MIRFVTFAFLGLTTLPALAQTISGTVLTAPHNPAPLAVVKLLRAADSTFVGGTVAGETGQYTFTAVPDGAYRIQASLVGMSTATSPMLTVQAGRPTQAEPVVLQVASQQLTAVTVRARKPAVEQQVDKTVLNVSADATAQSKTAYELLQQAPGVVIDPNDNIRMAGKQGVNVFIDGKPANLSATDLANLLRATPAASLETVELITNPSARFDAQGGAGIINLKFRRDKSLGLNGNVSGGYSQSDHHRSNAALDLNYRAKRLNLFGNVAASDNFQITNVAINRNAGTRTFSQRGYDTDGTTAVVYKAGVDYFMKSTQTIGLIVSGNAAANRFGTYTTTTINTGGSGPDSSILNRVMNPSQNSRINAALNYRYADTLGLELNLDADLTRFDNTSPSRITNDYANALGEPLFRRQNRFDATTTIAIVTLKSDLVKEWKARHLKLEAGLKHTDVATDNDLLAFVGSDDRADASRTNRFAYREIVSAAYASLNHDFGKKWTIQAGLRAEHATVRGRSTDLLNRVINRPDTAYLNLFPTAFVQYRATEASQFAVSYGQRIGRPNYQDMNPFIYQIDPYTSQRGNPFLRPTYTHNAELSYTYQWATTVKLAYSSTDDFATDVIRQEGLMGYQTVANVGRADALNLSINTPLPITRWWSSYLYAGATWTHFRGNLSVTEPFDTRAVAFNGYMQHSFTFSKVWSGQVSGFWNAPTQETVYRTLGLGAINVSIQKKVWHERGQLTVGVNDLLNTMHWRQSAQFGQQQFDLDRKWESRQVTLRFRYRFGSNDIKAARDRETGTDAARIKTKGNL